MKLFTCCYSKRNVANFDAIKVDDIVLDNSIIDDAEKESDPDPDPDPNIDIKYSDTVEFVPPIKGGRVVKVYDGDTITIASKLPYEDSPLYRFRVRLKGIDTPEIKGSTEEEKLAARLAKEYVEGLVLHKHVKLENAATEKFGRILADVYVGQINIGENLLKERYAVPYDGGKKVFPVSWLRYKQTGEMY